MARVTYPLVGGGDHTGPLGYTYAGVFVRVDARPGPSTDAAPGATGSSPAEPARERRDAVLEALRRVRFSGWVAPVQGGWVVAVAASGHGTVAAGRRGVVGLAQWLAADLSTTVVAVRVLSDRQLLLSVWEGADEVGRYVSDPSFGLPADDDTLPDPLGVEHAGAFAAVCGRPDDAEDLAELLAEELDPDSVIESERLAGVLRLLGLPGWFVAAASLPKDVPAGPRVGDLTRLGAGAHGLPGVVRGRAADVVRRRLRPPNDVPEAPRGPTIEPWM